MIEREYQFQKVQPEPSVEKPNKKTAHNAKERASRNRTVKYFNILSKCCSYFKSNCRMPSKLSILLAAKKRM